MQASRNTQTGGWIARGDALICTTDETRVFASRLDDDALVEERRRGTR